jgi:hypothetical protein
LRKSPITASNDQRRGPTISSTRRGRRIGLKEKDNALDEIIEVHDLQLAGIGNEGEDRHCGKTPDKGAPAEGSSSNHDRRTQDHPIEIACHESFVGGELAACKRR